jgi:predicted DNA-binding protein
MATNERSATAIRFPVEMHERLRDASEAHHLPVNYLVVKAVEEFLENLLPPAELRLTRREADPRSA